jgi:hypothetical protein
MKTIITVLSLLLLIISVGVAQQHGDDECMFTVQGEPTKSATITGPDDIAPLVYVVAQPDSPVEVVSADLKGMSLAISSEQHSERDCAKYKIRNRSDRLVQGFGIELMVASAGGASGFEAQSASPLPPGQTVEVQSCGGGGHGNAPENHVRLLVYVHSINLGDCFYRPSLRIPRSLKLQPLW